MHMTDISESFAIVKNRYKAIHVMSFMIYIDKCLCHFIRYFICTSSRLDLLYSSMDYLRKNIMTCKLH